MEKAAEVAERVHKVAKGARVVEKGARVVGKRQGRVKELADRSLSRPFWSQSGRRGVQCAYLFFSGSEF